MQVLWVMSSLHCPPVKAAAVSICLPYGLALEHMRACEGRERRLTLLTGDSGLIGRGSRIEHSYVVHR